jgi:hypothetical protein
MLFLDSLLSFIPKSSQQFFLVIFHSTNMLSPSTTYQDHTIQEAILVSNSATDLCFFYMEIEKEHELSIKVLVYIPSIRICIIK